MQTLRDIESEPPFNPINLLSIKSNVVLPTPGDFKQPDLYSRLRWRRIQYNVQHVSEEFWCRWQREFLASLQCRAKWQKINRNFKIDDILFPKTNTIRNKWPMAKVIDVYDSNNGPVQTVKLRSVGHDKFNENGSKYLVRRIHKIQLLFENDGVQFPEGQTDDLYN